MLFNSATFLLFFLVTYVAYLASMRHVSLQNFLLLLASYVFYSAWDVRFLALLILTTTVDYAAALAIEAARTRRAKKRYLLLSLVVNLGTLAIFKYFNFGVSTMATLIGSFGVEAHLPTLSIILPVGISFYTFQEISYTFDVYRGTLRAERRFFLFALYVSFFPQLVAGPIERASSLLPQLRSARSISGTDVRLGLEMVLVGFFKKVVLADTLAPIVEEVFDIPNHHSGAVVLLGVIAFAVQIYGDFSGYSLIARGISRMMGITLVVNFQSPYLASSPRDFWRRWHISLSTWLREYLYVPLGGSHIGSWRTFRNLMITMILGGLWHGAAWNFVLWGAYHGLLLVLAHALSGLRATYQRPVGSGVLLGRCITFPLILLGWVFFRSPTLTHVHAILHQLMFEFRWSEELYSYAVPVLLAYGTVILLQWREQRVGYGELLAGCPSPVKAFFYSFFLMSIATCGFRPIPFIYFQF